MKLIQVTDVKCRGEKIQDIGETNKKELLQVTDEEICDKYLDLLHKKRSETEINQYRLLTKQESRAKKWRKKILYFRYQKVSDDSLRGNHKFPNANRTYYR